MAQPMVTTKVKTGDTQSTAQTVKTMKGTGFSFTGPRIYLGPNNQKKGLRFGMGFRNGLPSDIIAECTACPAIFELIVVPSKINEVRMLLTQQGSAPHQALVQIEQHFNKKSGGE